MRLPFSVEQFLEVFRAYNLAVWPAQWVLYLAGVGLVLMAVRGHGSRIVPLGLALLWAWMGGIYHLVFFARINPAATIFGALFVLQALLWLRQGVRRAGVPDFQPPPGIRGVGGWIMVGYALLAYPLLNLSLGHRYPTMPTFGAPCPTTILTLGLMTWATPRLDWRLWVVPALWAGIGASAAFALGIREDLGLLGAGVLAVALSFGSRRASGPEVPSRTG